MKKLIVNVLVGLTVFVGCNAKTADVSVVDYKAEHKDAIVKIALQDPELFFPQYSATPVAGRGAFEQQMRDDCDEPLKYKKVALGTDGKVIAFAVYFKAREQKSLWGWLKQAKDEYYVSLESLAVDKDHRGKGLGTKLIKVVLKESQQKWPDLVSTVKLHITESNVAARKLYEREGFVRSKSQPMLMAMMKVVQYEKKLN